MKGPGKKIATRIDFVELKRVYQFITGSLYPKLEDTRLPTPRIRMARAFRTQTRYNKLTKIFIPLAVDF